MAEGSLVPRYETVQPRGKGGRGFVKRRFYFFYGEGLFVPAHTLKYIVCYSYLSPPKVHCSYFEQLLFFSLQSQKIGRSKRKEEKKKRRKKEKKKKTQEKGR